MIDWILINKEWIFSGVGATVFAGIVAWIFRRPTSPSQSQSSGNNSINIQAGKDIDIRGRK